ncbi:PQQ-dependent sugar dehydrogenase [Parapedobacter koreensis]|uniref:Glucose/arabinose dehydrogenase, beta-propeller fold n=1 Tax=Parapedobacter koreensis TaxID=332977 RepID=A0A1H7LUX0_9SPHI|nr:PQQ-dependent sugar dehydrogenase [Parapedobacter koreensis]SEL02744.1 Glucose/arabinose dehydrogenase, beta-propeller fold [Parapedobacter koreensis]
MKTIAFITVLSIAFHHTQLFGQDGNTEIIERNMEGHIFRPKQLMPTPENIGSLKLPPGFAIEVFAEGLGKSRMLAVAANGAVYVTDRDQGTLTLLQDSDGDGKAEIKKVLAKKDQLHGIAIDGDDLYLITVNELYKTAIHPDGSIDSLLLLVDDLPDGGQHGNRTLKIGPDNALYVSVGSTCNACIETNKENATMLKMNPDGSQRTIYATGLRNTIGFDWHPQTGELWGFDHGIDWLGNDEQQEELNKIVEGQDYGWPFVYGDGQFEVHHDPKNMTHEEYAAKSVKPTLLYDAHAAPMNLLFYTGNQFPGEFNGDAFVTMHGSWNRAEPSGYKIVRVRYENGQPTRIEDFITGFVTADKKGQFARVCGLAQHTDGSLLVADDAHGVVYRVYYK